MRLNPLKCTFGIASRKFLGYIINSRGIYANPKKIKDLIKMRFPKKSKEVHNFRGWVIALNRFVYRAIDKYIQFSKN